MSFLFQINHNNFAPRIFQILEILGELYLAVEYAVICGQCITRPPGRYRVEAALVVACVRITPNYVRSTTKYVRKCVLGAWKCVCVRTCFALHLLLPPRHPG